MGISRKICPICPILDLTRWRRLLYSINLSSVQICPDLSNLSSLGRGRVGNAKEKKPTRRGSSGHPAICCEPTTTGGGLQGGRVVRDFGEASRPADVEVPHLVVLVPQERGQPPSELVFGEFVLLRQLPQRQPALGDLVLLGRGQGQKLGLTWGFHWLWVFRPSVKQGRRS